MTLNIENIAKKLKKELTMASVSDGGSFTDPVDFVSSGNLALDWAIDGGFSFKFIVQLLGKSKSGKTALMLRTLASAQRDYNAYGLWADREGAFVRSFAEKLKVDMDRLLLVGPSDIPTPTDAFKFFQASHELIRAEDPEAYIVMCLDSVAAFVPQVGDTGEDMGRVAKALHRGFRTITTKIDDKTLLFFSNQVQAKIGVLFGKKTTAAGGGAPEYYSSYILELDGGKVIENETKTVIGQNIKCEVIKTRLGPAYRGIIMPFYYSHGYEYYGGFMRMLVHKGVMVPTNKTDFKAGKPTRYVYLETSKKYGEDEVGKLLKDHPNLMEVDVTDAIN